MKTDPFIEILKAAMARETVRTPENPAPFPSLEEILRGRQLGDPQNEQPWTPNPGPKPDPEIFKMPEALLTICALLVIKEVARLSPHNPLDAMRIIGKALAALQAGHPKIEEASLAFADGYNSVQGPIEMEFGIKHLPPGAPIHQGPTRKVDLE